MVLKVTEKPLARAEAESTISRSMFGIPCQKFSIADARDLVNRWRYWCYLRAVIPVSRRESTPQTFGNVLSLDWIPAFAGMTGGSIGSPFQMTQPAYVGWLCLMLRRLAKTPGTRGTALEFCLGAGRPGGCASTAGTHQEGYEPPPKPPNCLTIQMWLTVLIPKSRLRPAGRSQAPS
jgi:hypothetical protein